MHADGSKATGFRSMVVAQFTGVSLQKDDRAFVKYNKIDRDFDSLSQLKVTGGELSGQSSAADSDKVYHLDSDAIYRSGWETRHVNISNNAILQIVSVFAIGYNTHFEAKSGSDASITNSNSNFGQLALVSDGFRNYHKKGFDINSEHMLVDKAQLLDLTASEMTVLIGGMRALGISADGHGVFTDTPGKLTNDWFVTLLDMDVEWEATGRNTYVAKHRSTGDEIRTATRSDLVFGSNSQLRALAEVYAADGSHDKFVKDFISAWTKVMNLDRFDQA